MYIRPMIDHIEYPSRDRTPDKSSGVVSRRRKMIKTSLLLLFTLCRSSLCLGFLFGPSGLHGTARPLLLASSISNRRLAAQWMSAPSTDAKEKEDPTTMRLGEIQAELRGMGISYKDCFDKESLQKRLKDARLGLVKPEEVTASKEPATTQKATESSPSPSASGSSGTFDRETILSELRSLRVKEVRTRLSERSIRWAGLLEKEDLVRALADAMERAANFSPSGALKPGKVADITDEMLEAEIKRAKDVGTPLLLDVYATWCGPCQMMAPQLSAAAAELGEKARVAKIDSDKYP